MDALTPEEVAHRLSVATDGETVDPSDINKPKTWALTNQVVDNLVGFIRNPSERWYLGFPEIDLASRGVGKGEVLMVVGRSHTGKSQMLLNSIVVNLINDPATHVVIFSMDEPRELVAMKLFCLLKGRSSTEVEEAIKANDQRTIQELAEASEKELSRVAIIDESLPLSRMEEVMEEIREWFGTNPSFVMLDYLELLPGGDSDATGVTTKAQAVKRLSLIHI